MGQHNTVGNSKSENEANGQKPGWETGLVYTAGSTVCNHLVTVCNHLHSFLKPFWVGFLTLAYNNSRVILKWKQGCRSVLLSGWDVRSRVHILAQTEHARAVIWVHKWYTVHYVGMPWVPGTRFKDGGGKSSLALNLYQGLLWCTATVLTAQVRSTSTDLVPDLRLSSCAFLGYLAVGFNLTKTYKSKLGGTKIKVNSIAASL